MHNHKPSLYDAEPIPEAARAAVEALLASGDLFRYTAALGQENPVQRLEGEFAKLLGAKYALALNSCSSAIFLSLQCLDIKPGDKVLIPAFTFAAVPSAVVHAGAMPVLVEVGDNYRIDLADFTAKLTKDVKAVVISHMRGHTSDMDAILALCDAANIPLVEDAAHSLGTVWRGKNIGTLGAMGCFSFQSYKMINGGEGGILITNDEALIARAVIMSGAYEHNWQKHGLNINAFADIQNTLPLYNLRMSNLSAAVIQPQLAELDRRVQDGRANYNYVAAALNQSRWLSVPAPLEGEERAPDSIQFNLVGFSDAEAHEVMTRSAAIGCPISIFGLHQDNARAFWNWKFIGESPELPKTRMMLMRACDMRLPARLKREDLDGIIADIRAVINDVKDL